MTQNSKAIRDAEMAIFKMKQKLAKLRKKQKPEIVEMDYVFLSQNSKPVKLSKLFGNKEELIILHNMGFSCSNCTLWADGFNGLVLPLNDRATFYVENDESVAVQKKFAKSRGWKFKMLSSAGTNFKKDMGYQHLKNDKKNNWPGISTFFKKDGKIYRRAHAGFGPGDNFCVMWDIIDLLGDQDWQPKYKY